MGDRGGEALAEARRIWSINRGGATGSACGRSPPQARVEPHSHGQSGDLLPFQTCMQPLHGGEHPQPRRHSPPGVILARVGIAEVDQQAVAEQLGDMAALSTCCLPT
jgi:hypothetical protein